jgi:hypothetical protein
VEVNVRLHAPIAVSPGKESLLRTRCICINVVVPIVGLGTVERREHCLCRDSNPDFPVVQRPYNSHNAEWANAAPNVVSGRSFFINCNCLFQFLRTWVLLLWSSNIFPSVDYNGKLRNDELHQTSRFAFMPSMCYVLFLHLTLHVSARPTIFTCIGCCD